MIDPLELWDAFDQAGMLVEAMHSGLSVKVRKKQPDQLLFDGAAQTSADSIEYPVSLLTLARDDEITVGGIPFIVSQTPMKDADGWFAIALLEPA